METLVFDVTGDLAHFRKFYSTTSPLTYDFMPRTSVCGLLGAIAGLSREDYPQSFSSNKAKIGVGIRNEVRKKVMGIKLLDADSSEASFRGTKKGGGRTPITYEFLVDPKYRIYFQHLENELFEEIVRRVKESRPYYTPCLGQANLLASIEFMGVFKPEVLPHTTVHAFDSILPKTGFDLHGVGQEVRMALAPMEMDFNRVVNRFDYVLYSPRKGKLNAKPDKTASFAKVGNDVVGFL